MMVMIGFAKVKQYGREEGEGGGGRGVIGIKQCNDYHTQGIKR